MTDLLYCFMEGCRYKAGILGCPADNGLPPESLDSSGRHWCSPEPSLRQFEGQAECQRKRMNSFLSVHSTELSLQGAG